jgi:4-aminobutyrate aminotransferase-like enzyme
VVEEDMPGEAAAIERRIKSALTTMQQEIELIGDIRGRGVLLGVELVTDRHTKTPANEAARIVADHCLEHGLIFQLRGVGGALNVIRLVPPMTATEAEVDRAMSILYDALRRAARIGERRAAE